MSFTVSFHTRGERYRPSKIPFTFATQNDAGDVAKVGRYKGKPYPYGASEIRVPDNLQRDEKIPALVAMVMPVLPRMKEEGADSFYVSAGIFYDGQCNLEFTSRELALLASLECSFCLS